MTVDDLIQACADLSVLTSFTTKDGLHDMTHAVLELQVCLLEIEKSKRKLKEVNNILAAI